MSLRYRDSSGNETIVSGLTPGGDIEAGAVATRSGSGSISSTAGAWGQTTVTFTDPMPDADYIVNIEVVSQTSGSIETPVTVSSKTKNGFIASVYGGSTAVTLQFNYTAWKTYSVQHAAQNAADIAEIKSAIPTGAGSSNKLVTTSQFNNAVNPLTESIADIQDVIPADASITNKLVSQETLDSELEEADEGIWEAMGKNGAKNKLPFNNSHMRAINGGGTWNVNAYTYNGITYTLNSNGTITVNGTATAYSIFRIVDSNSYNFKLDSNETYYLTGSPATGSSSSTYYVYYSELIGGTWTYYINYGTGDTQFTPNASATQVVVDIIVRDGQSISSQIFKPMIRLASDTDSTYQPYALTNQQITEQIEQITPSIQSISNPNLLDNPFFTINQRGSDTYTKYGYTFDRWMNDSYNDIISISSDPDGGIRLIQNASGSNGFLVQKFESDLPAGIYTVSVDVASITSYFIIQCRYSDGTYSTYPRVQNTGITSLTFNTNAKKISRIFIQTYTGTDAVIRSIKLERGAVSTLANDVAPNYATELLKCQRYFYRLAPLATDRYGIITMGIILNQTTIRASIPLFVQMRTKPTVVFNLDTDKIKFGIGSSSSFLPITGMSVDNALPSLSTYFTCASQTTFSNGQAVHIWFVDTTSAYIDLSADL